MAYDGSTKAELREAWRTNELGFLIGICCYGMIAQILLKRRRDALRLAKKRFIYHQYRKSRFLEDSLMLKTREQIIQEGLFENTMKNRYTAINYFNKWK